MMSYAAVNGTGSTGGASKIHAADPATVRVEHDKARYRSLCGKPDLTLSSRNGALVHTPVTFDEVTASARCRRCVYLSGVDV